MIKLPELSVFFPFWNEAENIEAVVANAVSVLPDVAENWEVIMVDDGSKDATLDIAKKLASQDQRLRVVSHQPNRGYGAALKDGFAHAQFDHVVFTDGDQQFDFGEIKKFIPLIGSHDIVIGCRKQRHDHWFRHILMQLLKIWDFIFFGFYFRDIDCGFKMFTRRALEKLMPLQTEGAMITTEILAKARRAKLSIAEVEVKHFPRQYGNSSGGNVRVILRAVRESFNLWLSLK